MTATTTDLLAARLLAMQPRSAALPATVPATPQDASADLDDTEIAAIQNHILTDNRRPPDGH